MPGFLRQFLTWLITLLSTGATALLGPPEAPVIVPKDDVRAQEITVVSYNVYTNTDTLSQRMDGVIQTILGEEPDSFGLQEAHESWRFPLWWKLRKTYGIACWQGRYFGLEEATPIFYNKARYKLVKQGVFWLSDRPNLPTFGWDAALPRVAGYAVLKDKRTGFTYVHVNSHFDHKGATARANSARLIAEKINAMGLPAVFTADINARPNTLPPQYLEAGGLLDLREIAPGADTDGTFHGYGPEAFASVIDYIYANHYLRSPETASFRVIRDKYDGMYPSDHFAVAAAFTLAN